MPRSPWILELQEPWQIKNQGHLKDNHAGELGSWIWRDKIIPDFYNVLQHPLSMLR